MVPLISRFNGLGSWDLSSIGGKELVRGYGVGDLSKIGGKACLKRDWGVSSRSGDGYNGGLTNASRRVGAAMPLATFLRQLVPPGRILCISHISLFGSRAVCYKIAEEITVRRKKTSQSEKGAF